MEEDPGEKSGAWSSKLDTLGELVDATVLRTGALRKSIANNLAIANNLRPRRRSGSRCGPTEQSRMHSSWAGLVVCKDCATTAHL